MNSNAIAKLNVKGRSSLVDVRCIRPSCLYEYQRQARLSWDRYCSRAAAGQATGWTCGRCGGNLFEEVPETTT